MEITLTDATLYAAKENTSDCTTMTEKFEIKGNCRLMQANEFDPKNQYTVLTTGEWGHTTSALKPMPLSEALIKALATAIVIRESSV